MQTEIWLAGNRQAWGKTMAFRKLLARFAADRRGLAAVEYAFLCGLLVIAIITAFNSLASAIIMTWDNVSTQSGNAIDQATGA